VIVEAQQSQTVIEFSAWIWNPYILLNVVIYIIRKDILSI